MVSLEEAKRYLRVDSNEEDDVITEELEAAKKIVASILRKDAIDDSDDSLTMIAVLYAIAYLNEHREEADHHDLAITLRNLLFGEREAMFR
jgi:hypothetical protein